jgi:hypothetical protein
VRPIYLDASAGLIALRAKRTATPRLARKPAVPENGESDQVLGGAADELPSARETQPFLATSNQPPLPESEILDPSFLDAQRIGINPQALEGTAHSGDRFNGQVGGAAHSLSYSLSGPVGFIGAAINEAAVDIGHTGFRPFHDSARTRFVGVP